MRALIPCMRAPPSSDHLLKVPPPSTVTLEVRISICEIWWVETNIQSIALPEVSKWSACLGLGLPRCGCPSFPHVLLQRPSIISSLFSTSAAPCSLAFMRLSPSPHTYSQLPPSCRSPGELLGSFWAPPHSCLLLYFPCLLPSLPPPFGLCSLVPFGLLSCSGQPPPAPHFDTSELDSLTCCFRRPHHSNQRN